MAGDGKKLRSDIHRLELPCLRLCWVLDSCYLQPLAAMSKTGFSVNVEYKKPQVRSGYISLLAAAVLRFFLDLETA